MSLFLLIVIILFFFLLLSIGLFFSKRIYSNDDFAVADRHVSSIVLAGTLSATVLGSVNTLGVYEKAYGPFGLSATWYIFAMVIAFLIMTIIAPKIRKLELKTVSEFFRRRYGKTVGLVVAVFMIFPLIALTLVQFIAGAKILSIILNVDYKIALTIIAFVVITYTALGGLKGLVASDTLQFIIIFVGFLLVIPYSFRMSSNFSTAVCNVPLSKINFFQGISISTIIALIIMFIANFTVGQEISSKYFSIKHSYHVSKVFIITGFVLFVFAFFPSLLGIVTLALERMGRIDGSIIFVDGIKYGLPNFVFNYMPSFIIVSLFVALLAATMSSADSLIFSIGVIFANDIYRIYINKDAKDLETIKVSRIFIVIGGVVAYVLAIFCKASLIKVFIFAISLRAAGIFFPYVLGLVWKKASIIGVFASLLFGSASYALLAIKNIFILGLEPILIALFISLVAFILFSKFFPPEVESVELSVENYYL